MSALTALEREIIECRRCPRLVAWREQVAREKRAAFRDWDYWGRPIAGFGDPAARVVLLGLAPAAHGANRTGRPANIADLEPVIERLTMGLLADPA